MGRVRARTSFSACTARQPHFREQVITVKTLRTGRFCSPLVGTKDPKAPKSSNRGDSRQHVVVQRPTLVIHKFNETLTPSASDRSDPCRMPCPEYYLRRRILVFDLTSGWRPDLEAGIKINNHKTLPLGIEYASLAVDRERQSQNIRKAFKLLSYANDLGVKAARTFSTTKSSSTVPLNAHSTRDRSSMSSVRRFHCFSQLGSSLKLSVRIA
jgi:hypothetical protein